MHLGRGTMGLGKLEKKETRSDRTVELFVFDVVIKLAWID